MVVINANPKTELDLLLPKGEWSVLVDENVSGTKVLRTVKDKLSIKNSTGIVLKKK
jgi:hypothetical protein